MFSNEKQTSQNVKFCAPFFLFHAQLNKGHGQREKSLQSLCNSLYPTTNMLGLRTEIRNLGSCFERRHTSHTWDQGTTTFVCRHARNSKNSTHGLIHSSRDAKCFTAVISCLFFFKRNYRDIQKNIFLLCIFVFIHGFPPFIHLFGKKTAATSLVPTKFSYKSVFFIIHHCILIFSACL